MGEKENGKKKAEKINTRNALLISFALHGALLGVLAGNKTPHIGKSLSVVAIRSKHALSAMIHRSDIRSFKQKTKEPFEENPSSIDMGEFFLEVERLSGNINTWEKELAKKNLQKMIENLKAETDDMKSGTDYELRILHEIVQSQGDYMESSSTLSGILNFNRGNCEARAKLMVVLTKALLPDAKVKLQVWKDHDRAMAKINEQWYLLELPTPTLVTDKDLEGSAIYSSDAYIENFLGKDSDPSFMSIPKDSGKPSSAITDTTFSVGGNLRGKLKSMAPDNLPELEKTERVSFEDARWEKSMKVDMSTILLDKDAAISSPKTNVSPPESKLSEAQLLDAKISGTFVVTPSMLTLEGMENTGIKTLGVFDENNIKDWTLITKLPIKTLVSSSATIPVEAMRKLKSLKSLKYPTTSSKNLAFLPELPILKTLILTKAPLSSGDITSVIEKLKQLEKLSVPIENITGLEWLKGIQSLQQLEFSGDDNILIQTLPEKVFANSKNLKFLKIAIKNFDCGELLGLPINELELRRVEHLKSPEALKTLPLKHLYLAMQKMPSRETMEILKTMDIPWNLVLRLENREYTYYHDSNFVEVNGGSLKEALQISIEMGLPVKEIVIHGNITDAEMIKTIKGIKRLTLEDFHPCNVESLEIDGLEVLTFNRCEVSGLDTLQRRLAAKGVTINHGP